MTERRQIAGVGLMFMAVVLFAVTMAMWQASSDDADYEREMRRRHRIAADEAGVSPDRGPSILVGTLALVLFGSGIAVLSLGATTSEQRAALRLRRPGRPEGDL